MKKYILLSVIIFGIAQAGFFLDNGLGIKGMQVGGAYTAGPEGGEALYWNIGSLYQTKGPELYLSYSKKFVDVTDYSFTYVLDFGPEDKIGIGGFRSTVADNIYRNSAGNLFGSFEFANNAYFVGYSKQIGADQGVGITLKNVTQKAIDSSSYIGLDVGYSKTFSGFQLGFTAQDIYNNANANSNIKSIYRLGVVTELMQTAVRVDYMYHGVFEAGYLNYGLEYRGLPMVSLKGGYSGYNECVYAGVSLDLGGLAIDYLYSNPDLDTVHQFGIGYHF